MGSLEVDLFSKRTQLTLSITFLEIGKVSAIGLVSRKEYLIKLMKPHCLIRLLLETDYLIRFMKDESH